MNARRALSDLVNAWARRRGLRPALPHFARCLPVLLCGLLATSSPLVLRAREKSTKTETSGDERERFRPSGYEPHEQEVTISGRAVDNTGKPVSGVRVFVIPVVPLGVAYGNRDVIAEGRTDADGRYRLEKVKLSVLEFAPSAVPKPTVAQFQVFGIADGYGYSWRRTQAYHPGPRPAEPNADAALKHAFFADEPIALDLLFSPEVRLHGLINDDVGRPLRDATVQVGLVNTDRDLPGTPPRMWSGTYQADSPRGDDGAFEGFHVLPEPYRLARTDAEGKYEIRGIPRDCAFLCSINYRPECESLHATLVTGENAENRQLRVGKTGELNHTFGTPREVQVNVVSAEGSPVSHVVVRVDPEGRMRRGGAFARTGDDGEAALSLMPGPAKLLIEPSIGVPYLPKEIEIDVQRGEEPLELGAKLDRAAEVIFEAVESSTEKPVSGVALFCEEVDSGLRSPVESQLSFVDHPRTDEHGRLRAFLRPGTWRFAVNQRQSRPGFEPLAPVSSARELTADKPTVVRFEFASSTQPAEEAPLIAEQLKPLAQLLEQQREKYEARSSLRFRVRQHNHLTGSYSPAQMTELLDSLASKSVAESLVALRKAFPEFRRGLAEFELVCDGPRRRVTVNWNADHPPEVNLFNGEEMVISTDSGRQVDIYGRDNSMIHFLSPRDFWDGPARPAYLRSRNPVNGHARPEYDVRHLNGAWEIVYRQQDSLAIRTIDESTGLERRFAYGYNDKLTVDKRQYFPMLLESGIAYPKLSIEAQFQRDDQVRCSVTVIDSVEVLESVPAETFLYTAPAGTHILDYRRIPREELGRGRHPPSGVIAVEVPDVIAHRNRFAPPAEPVLKIGDRMPELKVSTWLTANGMADAPDYAGKVLVIDFWGISCGPCISQLPEVTAAAKHFAGSDIIVVGLHESGGTVEKVSEFAKKRGLPFPIAIDSADVAGRSFGVTFAAFGVSAIPTCAVVDGTGKIAWLGEFAEGIEVAGKLAAQK